MKFQDRLVHVAAALASIPFGCFAQNTQISVLQIDVQNVTLYVNDVTDYSKLATDPGVTTRQVSRNFNQFQFIGDVVAVNAKPAKGTWTTTGRSLGLSPAPSSGQAVADVTRGWSENHIFEILQPDGTAVGAITGSGYRQGSVPAAMTVANGTSNFAITGGTGAYLGLRGQGAQISTVAARAASVTEDPAHRRDHGGGTLRFVIQIIPLVRPQVLTVSGVPAVAHASDFTQVTSANPARPGETLSLFATGLGPTRGGVEAGAPFPTSPLAAVNSPVDVTFNGTSAELIGAVGFPGSVDGYQINFRVPSPAVNGTATVQLSAAWIAGSTVAIPVQQ